ncbi:hypothetical protein [Microbaculum marinum]|uniref:Sulfotransferase family protein n=1 Tax=Microbaculum marinum TaxID=1764581 RepID=A0AAW9S5I1_9HYPH
MSVNAVSNPAYSSTVLDAGTGRRTVLGTGRKGACAVLRPTRLAPGAPRTAVVLGIARGGTSMVAGTLRGLGVNMGDDLGFNHEDARVQQIVNRQEFDTFAGIAKARDAEHGLWGFKFPEASTVMDRFHPSLRNPHYLFVLRHPLARGQSAVKRTGGDLGASVVDALKSYEGIFAFLDGIDAPVLLVNYEQATEDREIAAAEIAAFLGIEATPERIGRAASMITGQGDGYVNLPEHAFYAAECAAGDAGGELAVPPGSLGAGEIGYAAGRASVWAAPEGGFPSAFVLAFALDDGRPRAGDAVRLYYDYEGSFHAGHRLLVEVASTTPAFRIEAASGLKRIAIVPMNEKSRATSVRFGTAG